jgi:hypothetical protein
VGWLVEVSMNEAPPAWDPQTEEEWQELATAAFNGVVEWRLTHPTATWAEVERAVDERLAAVRARLLQDVAEASAARDLAEAALPACPHCGTEVRRAGRRRRHLRTDGEQTVTLTRRYARCPACGTGLFPPG